MLFVLNSTLLVIARGHIFKLLIQQYLVDSTRLAFPLKSEYVITTGVSSALCEQLINLPLSACFPLPLLPPPLSMKRNAVPTKLIIE